LSPAERRGENGESDIVSGTREGTGGKLPELLAGRLLPIAAGAGGRIRAADGHRDVEDAPRSEHLNGEHQSNYSSSAAGATRRKDIDDLARTSAAATVLSLGENREIEGQQQRRLTETSTTVSASRSAEHKPRHPQFADESKRIESFAKGRVGPGQSAQCLARAGFFYMGPEDNVRCFHCDGGLKNWKPTDDPWSEHARWFPRCPFLLANKDASPTHTNLRAAAAAVVDSAPSCVVGLAGIPYWSQPGQYTFEAREIKARMDSPLVQSVIGMGFQRELVRNVIETKLKTTGDDFTNLESLVQAILELHDELSRSADANLRQQQLPQLPGSSSLQQAASSTSSTTTTGPTTATTTTVRFHEQLQNFPSSSGACSGVNEDSMTAKLQKLQMNQQTYNNDDSHVMLEENRQLKEARMCKVCMDKDVDTVFLPCGHLVCCSNCSPALRNCAICRTLIRGTVKVFLS
jgi:hypothetical protein